MSNPLVYKDNRHLLPDDSVFKISPSKFASFITAQHNWFRTEVLKEDGFMGSTSSVIGTIIHHLAQMVAEKEEVNKDHIYEYIESHSDLEDYCEATVRSNFEEMASVLINDYVLPNMDNYLEVEKFHYAEVSNGFYAAGTPDFLSGTKEDLLIGDYKSYHSKTKPKTIPPYYKYQLLVLAFILRKKGYNPSRMRLVYINRNIDGGVSEKTNKPLKSYPPEVTVLTEDITEEDMDFITSQLELCVESCLATDDYPELTHIIWHDARLRI